MELGGFVVCRGLSWTVVRRQVARDVCTIGQQKVDVGVGYPRRLYECQV